MGGGSSKVPQAAARGRGVPGAAVAVPHPPGQASVRWK